ncbi:MAG TPA: cell envelope integrity protein CreD, partial [Saprospiraceae bacterium]|nr:cell envelope integrity protein CreD [Saprospiraceae bacterium]
FLPENVRVNAQATPEKRYRGIFEVVLYNSQIAVEGNFARPDMQQLLPAGATVLWEKSVLTLGIPDLRGLNDQVAVEWGSQAHTMEPDIPVPGVAESGIHLPLDLTNPSGQPYAFRMQISLKGSGSLFFTPVGRVTDVALSAPWGDPSFTGAFLPDEKNVTHDAFEAKWKVLNLNRNYPQQWTSDQEVQFSGSAFGVNFLLPVDNYQKATRSVKYAILFISLTFLTIFFIEMRQAQRRVHPFQYMLIGLALVIFYTLLVSLSEHLSYNTAYFIAAAMTIGLSTYYARSLFDSNALAMLVGGTLTVLYGFLFVVLQQQDYALLIGSFGLFFILAAVMYVSKKINWE